MRVFAGKMKVIIPLAGKGTRLRPHTHSKPKPLIKVAGKAVLGHILDRLKGLDITEITFITGEMGEQIRQYVEKHYSFKARYIHQHELLGDGYAISLAAGIEDEDVLIVFVDTIFETDLSIIRKCKGEGIVWVKQTENPERFGIVTLHNGFIAQIEEKPKNPASNLAVIGLYYFRDSKLVFKYLSEIINRKTTTNHEYRLADAMALMIKDGIKLEAPEVDVWADCGKPETLLETNRYLLSNGHGNGKEAKTVNSVILEPVYIDPTARIEHSIIGPNVSIAGNCQIRHSMIQDSIIDQNSHVEHCALRSSLIGDSAIIKDNFRKLNVGDNSEIDFGK